MRKLLFLFALTLPCAAQTPTMQAVPATNTAPIGTYLDCTAMVNGVNNKTVTWTSTGGTLKGLNPGTDNEPQTIALTSATAGGPYTVTATSNSDHTTTATCSLTFTATPTPTAGHPRLAGVTSTMLPALQAKAVSGNKLYNSGTYAFGVSLFNTRNSTWSWSCNGGNGQPSADEINDAYLLQAIETWGRLAEVDPSDATYHWGCYARDAWLYYENMMLMPYNTMYNSSSLGLRDNYAHFGVEGNFGADSSEYLALAPDTLMGAPNGAYSPGWYSQGSGATLSATISGGAVNAAAVTAGGSGYIPSSVVYWYAPVGTSGCASIGTFAVAFVGGPTTSAQIPMAAMGVVQTNSSGVVSGTVSLLSKTGTTCTSAPAVVVYNDHTLHDNYFYVLGQQEATGANCGCGQTALIGGYNSNAQFDTGSAYDFTGQRNMGNNYTHAKILYLVALSLTLDNNTTDDPSLPNNCSAARGTVCSDGTAGSLHAYWNYLTGGMLYKLYAHIEDPHVSFQAYTDVYANLGSYPALCDDYTSPTSSHARVNCFGDGRNGESSEGNWYAYSMYREALAIASIQSAGYDNPLPPGSGGYGPQLSWMQSTWWDQKLISDLSSLSYTSNYTGSNAFTYITTGDTHDMARSPLDFEPQAWMMVIDGEIGRTDRTAREEWPLIYTPFGGPGGFYTAAQNDYASSVIWPMFLALPSGDPTTSPPADPRLGFLTDYYTFNNFHVNVKSGWVSNGPISPAYGGGSSTQTVFDVTCPNTRIDHEHEFCGRFDIESNGEFITLGRTVFADYNTFLSTAEQSNALGLAANQSQTECTVLGGCFMGMAAQGFQLWSAQIYPPGSVVGNGSSIYHCTATLPSNCIASDVPGVAGDWTLNSTTYGGGQMWHGEQAGTFSPIHSELPAYVGYSVDDTAAYNASPASDYPAINGVSSASRSLLYLRGSKRVIVYDRGAANNYARDWLTTTGPVTITGNTTKWSTRSGNQDVYDTLLLPASGVTISDAGAYLTNENGNPGTLDWEPYTHILDDAGSVVSGQFLYDVEWGASGFTKSTTTLVQSSAGQNFDGALIGGSTLAMFMRSWPASFTGVTYPASGATTQYVSNLTPNTTYTVAGTGAPSTCTSDNAGVCTFATAGTGNIVLSPGGATAAPIGLSGTISISGSVQIP